MRNDESEAQPIPVIDQSSGDILGVLLDGEGNPICLTARDIQDILDRRGLPVRDDEMPF